MDASLITYIVAIPLLGFIINGLFGKYLPKSVVGLLASLCILIPFSLVLPLYGNAYNEGSERIIFKLFSWFDVGKVHVDFSFQLDRLSLLMLMIITGVGSLIHIYSIGYMKEDPRYHIYFSYLNLFVFFMILLVSGSNLIVTFIGWEGVGLASYLLIGFWFKKVDYSNAAKKAFIMNRIGDLGLLLGAFMIFKSYGTIEYAKIAELAKNGLGSTVVDFIAICLFIGAIGKSAQLPLFTWLPDAMAGPTPVSALIHAATMVTAGIFLVVRFNFFYEISPLAKDIILYVGLATALFAGLIGIAQNDIKKVLAYSTVSQLGFMFIALGLGVYTTAMFHLTTHAFFKALLFLGAGSVIHAMHNEQDIRKMGGLRKKLPITFITFLIATLAITGIPPFAGFFSKDEILANAFQKNQLVWALTLLGALLTAFYMFRLLFLTFFGKFRGGEEAESHLHESPPVMTIPLAILAVLSTIGGFIGIPAVFGGKHYLSKWLEPLFTHQYLEKLHAHHLDHNTELILMGLSVALVVVVAIIASRVFSKNTIEDKEPKGLSKILSNKFYVDEIYNTLIVKPISYISMGVWILIDRLFINGIVYLTGLLVQITGTGLKYIQTGNIGFYILMMVLGTIAFLLLNTVTNLF